MYSNREFGRISLLLGHRVLYISATISIVMTGLISYAILAASNFNFIAVITIVPLFIWHASMDIKSVLVQKSYDFKYFRILPIVPLKDLENSILSEKVEVVYVGSLSDIKENHTFRGIAAPIKYFHKVYHALELNMMITKAFLPIVATLQSDTVLGFKYKDGNYQFACIEHATKDYVKTATILQQAKAANVKIVGDRYFMNKISDTKKISMAKLALLALIIFISAILLVAAFLYLDTYIFTQDDLLNAF